MSCVHVIFLADLRRCVWIWLKFVGCRKPPSRSRVTVNSKALFTDHSKFISPYHNHNNVNHQNLITFIDKIIIAITDIGKLEKDKLLQSHFTCLILMNNA